MPIIDILCNECGEFFSPEQKELNIFSHWKDDTLEDIGPFSHWKEGNEDDDGPTIRHFNT